MLIVYRMYYNRNCPFRIGNNMIVTDSDEWKQKVYNYLVENEENYSDAYKQDIEDGLFSETWTFSQWVNYYLEHMVFTDRHIVDNYKISIPY